MPISFKSLGAGQSTNLVGPGNFTLSIPAGAFRITNSHSVTLNSTEYAAGERVAYFSSNITSAQLAGQLASGLTSWGAGLARGFDAHWGNGLYILLGGNTNYYTSTNGTTWTTRTLPITSTPIAIRYGNGLWIMQFSTTIYSSTDGISWTLRHTLASGSFVNANDGGGPKNEGTNWIIPVQGPSVNGGVLHSTNGTSWTYTALTSSYRSWSSYMQDGLWIIGSDSGRIHYSTDDGAIWTQVSIGSGSNVYGINKHNSLYVFALASGQVWTSPSGTGSFTQRTISAGSETLTSVESAFGLVWIESNTGNLYSSPDGITWSNSGYGLASDTTMRKLPNTGELIFINNTTTTYILGFIPNSALVVIEELGEVTLPNA